VLDGLARIVGALRQVAQHEMRGRRGQQAVGALQVGLGADAVALLLARQAAIQMVRKVLAIGLDRLAVILFGFGDAAEALQRIAAQRMENRLRALRA
jgi:hypothetical protein